REWWAKACNIWRLPQTADRDLPTRQLCRSPTSVRKAALIGAALSRQTSVLLLHVFFHVLRRVLYVACNVVRAALDLIHLALGLSLGVTRQTSDSIFRGALGFIPRALSMFLVHIFSPP